MNGELSLRNRQRTRPVDLKLLRQVTLRILEFAEEIQLFDLDIQLVGEKEMASLNSKHVGHEGSTDVITIDYEASHNSDSLIGELFVCVDEALIQARRFKTTWQEELVRYIAHGVLHLRGYDDLKPAARRAMKVEENRQARQLAREFNLSKLHRKTRVGA